MPAARDVAAAAVVVTLVGWAFYATLGAPPVPTTDGHDQPPRHATEHRLIDMPAWLDASVRSSSAQTWEIKRSLLHHPDRSTGRDRYGLVRCLQEVAIHSYMVPEFREVLRGSGVVTAKPGQTRKLQIPQAVPARLKSETSTDFFFSGDRSPIVGPPRFRSLAH
jgi:hypothetical protein